MRTKIEQAIEYLDISFSEAYAAILRKHIEEIKKYLNDIPEGAQLLTRRLDAFSDILKYTENMVDESKKEYGKTI